ncbi:hypothetical protein JXA40_12625 [bacterium]|nr:hypothetical protein [candidate division CSSED10-310 bacterium]
MAVVTAFRFTENSGGICVDQESWHIWRRKTWFTDHLYVLVPEKQADRYGIELVYGGSGHPPFHREVAETAGKRVSNYLENRVDLQDPVTVEMLGREVLEAFRAVRSRRMNDRLEYLFGFNSDDCLAGRYMSDGQWIEISLPEIKSRAMKIIQGIETTGYNPLSPPVEACLIGIDRQSGYSAFAIKESDGVLSFQSCWFESLGQGRDGAAMGFSQFLNRKLLESRRRGPGDIEGLIVLLEAICQSMNHYGQNGGFIRFMLLNSGGESRNDRIRDIRDDRARLSLEIIRAKQAGLLPVDSAKALLSMLIWDQAPVPDVEKRLFGSVDDPVVLGKLLRGYKIFEPGIPTTSPESTLFLNPSVVISESERKRS